MTLTSKQRRSKAKDLRQQEPPVTAHVQTKKKKHKPWLVLFESSSPVIQDGQWGRYAKRVDAELAVSACLRNSYVKDAFVVYTGKIPKTLHANNPETEV